MTTIVDYGFFKPIEIEDTPDNPGPHLLRYHNEKGEDWYELRKGLTEWEANTGKFISAIFGAWALADADGTITNIEYDPSRLAPLNKRVLGIDAKWKDIKPGTLYRDGELADGPLLSWLEGKP